MDACLEKCACRGSYLDKFLQPAILVVLQRGSSHGFQMISDLEKSGMVSGNGLDRPDCTARLNGWRRPDLSHPTGTPNLPASRDAFTPSRTRGGTVFPHGRKRFSNIGATLMLFSAAYYPPKSFETVKYYISFFRITAAVKAKIGSDTAKTCSIREKGVAIRCLPTRAIILSILRPAKRWIALRWRLPARSV